MTESEHVQDVIPVGLAGREYDILVGYEWLQHFGETLRDRGLGGEIMVFTSPRIGGLYYAPLEQGLRAAGYERVVRHDIPDGESSKCLDEYRTACEALADNFGQSGAIPLVLNLGGGVVGDLGGFVAASYRRGIPYVQLPTTLLACVDCGVGGKTGIDFAGAKNLLGAIYQPGLVMADLRLLSTLDQREMRSGMAEVIKYGVVNSESLFELLEENMAALMALDRDLLMKVAGECYRIKAAVVVDDEFDRLGKRIVLNFGHTVGHALEMATDCAMTHGEAVAVGMLAATRIAIEMGECPESLYDRLSALLRVAGLPVSAAATGVQIEVEQVLNIMRRDKKFISGQNRFVLPCGLGCWKTVSDIDEGLITSVVQQFLV